MVSGDAAARHRPALLLVLLCWSLPGCGPGKGPQTYPVSGMVLVDGQPLADGYVMFRDKEGNSATYAARVKEGAYALRSTRGVKIVQVTASRSSGRMVSPGPGMPPEPLMEQYIAAEYSDKSQHEIEVSADHENVFRLEVKSTGPPGSASGSPRK